VTRCCHSFTQREPRRDIADTLPERYGISENNPGFIYKFVPDRRGDLASGQLYALKITNPTGDRTGDAEWIPLDRAAVRVDAQAAAAAAGATGYNRPEDVEIATSSGNSHDGPTGPVDNRVIAIDLNGPFVYDYVRVGLNATAEFEWPDNLALSKSGDLAIAEDPVGSFPSKRKGDDIWIATPGKGPHAPAASVVRFATLTDCTSEPTGIYFDIRGWGLFVNAQHRGGDGLDKAVLITPSAQ
jgi:hypothetical protein